MGNQDKVCCSERGLEEDGHSSLLVVLTEQTELRLLKEKDRANTSSPSLPRGIAGEVVDVPFRRFFPSGSVEPLLTFPHASVDILRSYFI